MCIVMMFLYLKISQLLLFKLKILLMINNDTTTLMSFYHLKEDKHKHSHKDGQEGFILARVFQDFAIPVVKIY